MPTHGSLTKAGKVRNQTPKIESMNKKTHMPRTNNLKKHHKRIVLGQTIHRRRQGIG